MNAAGFCLLLLALFILTSILNANCLAKTISEINRGVVLLKLMLDTLRPRLYHLPGNVISATVGIVNINLQPEYELSSSTRFGQFKKSGKI